MLLLRCLHHHTCYAALNARQLLIQAVVDGLKHQPLTPQVVYLLPQLLVERDGLQAEATGQQVTQATKALRPTPPGRQ